MARTALICGAANVIGLSLMLAIFSGLASFHYNDENLSYTLLPKLDSASTVNKSFKDNQQYLVLVMCRTHFVLALAIIVLTLAYAMLRPEGNLRALIVFLMLVPIMVLFCMLLYFSIRQQQIIQEANDNLKDKYDDYKVPLNCESSEHCIDQFLSDVKRFWFLGVFSSCLTTLAFTYAILFYSMLKPH